MNKNICYEKSRPSCPSFFEILNGIEEACEVDFFDGSYKEQAKELCLIIAEVKMLNPESEIRVSGVMLSCAMVQEVYSKIGHEHLEIVIDNFKKITYEVKNKKAYLRTALYNCVFEFESHWENKFRQDFSK